MKLIYDKYFRQFAKTKQLKLVRVSVSFMEKEGAFIRDFLSGDKNSYIFEMQTSTPKTSEILAKSRKAKKLN